MSVSEREAGNRRAAVHFWAWSALGSLARALACARGSARESAALDAWDALERLLTDVEHEAAAATAPLPRPPPHRENHPVEQEESAQGGRCPARSPPPVPAGGMTVDEFLAWQANEPDSYELVDGVPVRMPDDAQGGRRIGRAFAAAELALGSRRAGDWAMKPVEEFGGRRPALVAAESWQGLVTVLEVLRRLSVTADRDPDDEEMFARPGQSLDGLFEEARRMAAIQRARASGVTPVREAPGSAQRRNQEMAFGDRPAGCPAEIDAIEVSAAAWPGDEPFPLTAEECLWLLRGHAVQPRSGPLDVDTFQRLPRKIELLRGRLYPE